MRTHSMPLFLRSNGRSLSLASVLLLVSAFVLCFCFNECFFFKYYTSIEITWSWWIYFLFMIKTHKHTERYMEHTTKDSCAVSTSNREKKKGKNILEKKESCGGCKMATHELRTKKKYM